MAQSCFMKAEDKYLERSTEGHHLRANAVNARASYTEMMKLFENAAKSIYSNSKSWPMRDRIIEQQVLGNQNAQLLAALYGELAL
ncbi:hypothetical protein Tco_0822914 [Tanacetum coccineum]|uniref:Uncharacterized protein n=1 Tax=Tanacetum coccineum TaxID=301880 RepID=A0ABQ5AGF5_9ASTR